LDNLKVGQEVRKTIDDIQGESFLDVVAPIFILNETKIDLVPEEIKMQKAIEEQGRETIKMGVLVIVILVLVCAVFLTRIYFKSIFLTTLKTNFEAKREKAQALEHISEKTRIVKDYLNSRMVTLEMIDELYRILPDEIYLSSITLDEKGTITIQGTSESMSRVFSLVTALEDSNFFKSVKTNSTTAKKERGKDVAAFELTFKLESAKDDGTEAAKEKEEVDITEEETKEKKG
jgi:Tfp pilus assembly protein PilN